MNRSMGDKDSPTMFLNPHQDYSQSPPHSGLQYHHHPTSSSDESDIKKQHITTIDRESLEVIRRPRGRPPGSKNKQKPPVVSSADKETQPYMSPYVLEVVDGSDVIDAVTRFCNQRQTGLCVLSVTGSVCNVSMQQQNGGGIFRGPFSLLSISAIILPMSSPISTTNFFTNSNNKNDLSKFVVSLAGPDGRTFGGAVVGPLIASGTVYIVAATFNNPIYHRLPRVEEDDDHIRNSGFGSVSAGSGGGDSRQHHAEPPLPFSMYGGHFPTDVIMALTQRQAPPHSSLF